MPHAKYAAPRFLATVLYCQITIRSIAAASHAYTCIYLAQDHAACIVSSHKKDLHSTEHEEEEEELCLNIFMLNQLAAM